MTTERRDTATGMSGVDAGMETTTNPDMSGAMESSVRQSPVDDRTYNLLQALTSKLEAIEAYEIYEQDDDGVLFSELIEDERRHAERLLAELRSALGGG